MVPLCQPPPLCTPSLDPSSAPSLPPARPGVVSVWQALGPVRRPVGCDGQQLCVPFPAVWRPLGSRSGAQSAKVTSLLLSEKINIYIFIYTGRGSCHFPSANWTAFKEMNQRLVDTDINVGILFQNADSSCEIIQLITYIAVLIDFHCFRLKWTWLGFVLSEKGFLQWRTLFKLFDCYPDLFWNAYTQ